MTTNRVLVSITYCRLFWMLYKMAGTNSFNRSAASSTNAFSRWCRNRNILPLQSTLMARIRLKSSLVTSVIQTMVDAMGAFEMSACIASNLKPILRNACNTTNVKRLIHFEDELTLVYAALATTVQVFQCPVEIFRMWDWDTLMMI